eukprot:1156458-Pelagomonas_calceolata.AAC.14
MRQKYLWCQCQPIGNGTRHQEKSHTTLFLFAAVSDGAQISAKGLSHLLFPNLSKELSQEQNAFIHDMVYAIHTFNDFKHGAGNCVPVRLPH